ncbi:MAG: lipocalin-like domain-containing protein [Chloroflexi bacterium]|nr:lipocalin-like domain-containing protein [Chloroflexota bacterium]
MKELLGTWKLISAEYRRKSGEVIEIYGANPMGQLTYDADGNMSIQIMRQGRPMFAV